MNPSYWLEKPVLERSFFLSLSLSLSFYLSLPLCLSQYLYIYIYRYVCVCVCVCHCVYLTSYLQTSMIQELAASSGNKLLVQNMNQQSESTDLLGGFQPVNLLTVGMLFRIFLTPFFRN
jgi:hypothetical protein